MIGEGGLRDFTVTEEEMNWGAEHSGGGQAGWDAPVGTDPGKNTERRASTEGRAGPAHDW